MGKIKVGPIPSSHFPTSFGVGASISMKTVSPNPVVRSISRGLCGCGAEFKTVTTGLVMIFQFFVSATGNVG